MPRQNQPRTVGSEDALAQRIAVLRSEAEPPLSYEALAARMSAVGCPIQPSALHRIEKGSPRRKVTVDELVALSQVFEVPIEDLISSPADDPAQRAQAALDDYRKAVVDWRSARQRLAASALEEQLAFKVLLDRRAKLPAWQRRLAAEAATEGDTATPETQGFAAFLRQVITDIDLELAAAPPKIIVSPWVDRDRW